MNRRVTYLLAHFGGRVQGVGFRYLTRQCAHGFEVTGTVQNLADGRVRLEAEGEEVEVRAFFEELCHRLSDYIRETETRWSERMAQFTDFDILR